jgi:hypothetical protein
LERLFDRQLRNQPRVKSTGKDAQGHNYGATLLTLLKTFLNLKDSTNRSNGQNSPLSSELTGGTTTYELEFTNFVKTHAPMPTPDGDNLFAVAAKSTGKLFLLCVTPIVCQEVQVPLSWGKVANEIPFRVSWRSWSMIHLCDVSVDRSFASAGLVIGGL